MSTVTTIAKEGLEVEDFVAILQREMAVVHSFMRSARTMREQTVGAESPALAAYGHASAIKSGLEAIQSKLAVYRDLAELQRRRLMAEAQMRERGSIERDRISEFRSIIREYQMNQRPEVKTDIAQIE